jgi:tRNA 2-thiouridine synthesizing protein E
MGLEYNGSSIETDENGYLVTLEDWSEGVAEKLAEDEEIEMNGEHWEIINFLRDYYQEFQIAPAVKVLTKAIAKKNDIKCPIIWNGYKYVCEIDLLQLDTMSEKIGFFDDSFGYLFIKSNWIINENCGAFLMQST